ncbi:hypothetical protein Curi_c21960 [Gottschalkia acidurici 9a]|uniref:Uncharacterized protein n=1 Tax=Gottschalkia acidurici (strain ATCC 7906 / DSM 604 / BCRC 14475 / CIP 104303 / KCTC 5404 / NCIMB 10678 / 9a) TaxID=1128398 RepID=K0B108_GOTA9|nr:hypothetical protein Curi_c21960 [Gottschalkia acidurici 9a]
MFKDPRVIIPAISLILAIAIIVSPIFKRVLNIYSLTAYYYLILSVTLYITIDVYINYKEIHNLAIFLSIVGVYYVIFLLKSQKYIDLINDKLNKQLILKKPHISLEWMKEATKLVLTSTHNILILTITIFAIYAYSNFLIRFISNIFFYGKNDIKIDLKFIGLITVYSMALMLKPYSSHLHNKRASEIQKQSNGIKIFLYKLAKYLKYQDDDGKIDSLKKIYINNCLMDIDINQKLASFFIDIEGEEEKSYIDCVKDFLLYIVLELKDENLFNKYVSLFQKHHIVDDSLIEDINNKILLNKDKLKPEQYPIGVSVMNNILRVKNFFIK